MDKNLSVKDKEKIESLHESLHNSYELYTSHQKNKRDNLINELNAYRAEVNSSKENWNNVFESIQRDPAYFEIRSAYSPQIISDACETMEYLQKYLPESAITHILLNCNNAVDLINWRIVKIAELKELAGKSKDFGDKFKEIRKELTNKK